MKKIELNRLYAKDRQLKEQAKRNGFDRCSTDWIGAHIGCSQCNALSINGHATHEHGCPNTVRPYHEPEEMW